MSIADKLAIIADNEPKVYEAGKQAGKQAEQDAFWDVYQDSGLRTDYSNAFSGVGWSNDNFKPLYNINATNAYMMFRGSAIKGDLVEIAKNLGITVDFTGCQNFQYAFYGSALTRLGVIDASNVVTTSNLAVMFYGATLLHTIDKFITPLSDKITYTNIFQNCTALENITIEGVIGQSIDFKDSPKLSKASITSVINALKEDINGMPSATFSKNAVENAFSVVDCLVNAVYAESQTKDGLTITNNGDGSFTLNGTYAGTEHWFLEAATVDTSFMAKGTYILSLEGDNTNGIEDIYTTGGLGLSNGKNTSVTPNGDTDIIKIVIQPGATFNNVTIRPTLVYDEWDSLIHRIGFVWTIALV